MGAGVSVLADLEKWAVVSDLGDGPARAQQALGRALGRFSVGVGLAAPGFFWQGDASPRESFVPGSFASTV